MKKKAHLNIWLALSMFLLAMAPALTVGKVIYVDSDANGANDGSSWANAYNLLQDALAEADSSGGVNKIRVAAGIYKPDANSASPDGSNERTATFQLVNGVALKGGYAGYGEADANARDIKVYETILSGDLDGNDVGNFDDPSKHENSYHVVTGSGTDATAVLDGFTIAGGYANGFDSDGKGGGMYNDSGSPTVIDCTFTRNSSNTSDIGDSNHPGGGGVYNNYGSPIMTNCTFTGNFTYFLRGVSSSTGGGGMYNFGGIPILTNCTFTANSANFSGGGMYEHAGSGTVTNCTFIGNTAKRGGGIYFSSSSSKLLNCTFKNNLANQYGGGIYFRQSSPTLTNCTIIGNSAFGYSGGGICLWSSNPIMSNCTFSGNSVRREGGGICLWSSDPIIVNCIITGNTAYDRWAEGGGVSCWASNPTIINCSIVSNWSGYGGGGISCDYGSRPTITQCTINNNFASKRGGAVYCRASYPVIMSSILHANNALEGKQLALTDWNGTIWPSVCAVSYSDLQGGQSGVYIYHSTLNWHEGNVDADPCFVQPGYWDANGVWVEGDYHLLAGSPCIDAGDNNSVPADTGDLDGDGDTNEPIPWDLDGNPRITDGNNDGNSVVDMGAYEFWPPVEVAMKFTPQALNPGSQGNWIKAHFVLPEEFAVEDVDADRPAVVEPGGIESDYMNVFVNDDGLVEIEAAFGRAEFCSIITGGEPMEVRVVGSLTSGRQFYGTDTIKITTNTFEYLAVLASHWLEAECGKPDWCGGADVDQDSLVNFSDFVLFDGCCIEVVKE